MNNISTAANAYRAMLTEKVAPLEEEAMTFSLSGFDKTNKFLVWCKLQYQKYNTTITDSVSVTFKKRQDAEKFAKIAGSHVLTQTTSAEDEEIIELAKKQLRGQSTSTVEVMYPIDGHKTEFEVTKVYNRGKVEYIVQNPSSIARLQAKTVFSSAEEAADAVEKSGAPRPKLVKA